MIGFVIKETLAGIVFFATIGAMMFLILTS